MRIGIVSPSSLFPPTSGAPKRTFKIAEGLYCNGCSVVVLHPGPTKTLYAGLKLVGFDHFETFPLTKNFTFSSAIDVFSHSVNLSLVYKLHRVIRKWNIDVLIGERAWTTFPSIVLAKKHDVPFVLDEHNVEFISTKAGRVPFFSPYILAMESFGIKHSEMVLTVSHLDKRCLIDMYKAPSGKIAVVPNGVDISRFRFLSTSKARKKLGIGLGENIVFFHGLLSWRPNREAAETIIRYIAPKMPKVKFLIAGNNPLSLQKEAFGKANVKILGYVPNIEDYISTANVCVVPLRRGSGTRLKILEYFAAGKPVVSTCIGAEGIPIKSGFHAILHDHVDDAFIRSVEVLLSDGELASEMGVSARQLATKFDWKIIAKRLFLKCLELVEFPKHVLDAPSKN